MFTVMALICDRTTQWALHFTVDNDVAIFVTTFLAIIPLAKLLGFATEELAFRVGQTIGGVYLPPSPCNVLNAN